MSPFQRRDGPNISQNLKRDSDEPSEEAQPKTGFRQRLKNLKNKFRKTKPAPAPPPKPAVPLKSILMNPLVPEDPPPGA